MICLDDSYKGFDELLACVWKLPRPKFPKRDFRKPYRSGYIKDRFSSFSKLCPLWPFLSSAPSRRPGWLGCTALIIITISFAQLMADKRQQLPDCCNACESRVLGNGVRGCMRAQSSLILCDPKDCSPPGSSVHGISQARILEWVAISSSRGSSPHENRTGLSCVGKRSFQQSPPPKFLFPVDFCSTSSRETLEPTIHQPVSHVFKRNRPSSFLLRKHYNLMVSMKNVLSVFNFGFRAQLKHGCVYITL